jgi:hypothetical protein
MIQIVEKALQVIDAPRSRCAAVSGWQAPHFSVGKETG